MLSQLAAVQAQLHRIEEAVQDVALDVKSVLSFLETGQRAEIAAALDIVGDVHRRQQESGEVAVSDWYRLAGVELVLRKQHQQVAEELSRRLSSSTWTGDPKGDARAMKEVKPARVAELLNLLRLLAGGLWRWEENVLIHRLTTERVGESDLDAQERALKRLDAAHTSVVTVAAEVERRAARTRPRSNWSRLFSDGLVLGSHNDEKDLRSVAEGRKVLRRLTDPVAPGPTPALAARPALELVAA